MKDKVQRIKLKIDKLSPIEIEELERYLFQENIWVNKLRSDEWPKAADEMTICGENEYDKKARAMAVFNLFIADRMKSKNIRLLDYGCGEGYVSKVCIDEGVKSVVGYDIVDYGWKSESDNLFFTTKREEISGKFDVILMYDVLDHVVDREPQEVLTHARSLLAENGIIIIRFHPWSSRHGTHLWKLNKMHAHVIFTDEELAELGYVNMPTYKVTKPRIVYPSWIGEAGLRTIWENSVYEQTGPLFENNPGLKSILTKRIENFGYHDIEETFKDYVVKAR